MERGPTRSRLIDVAMNRGQTRPAAGPRSEGASYWMIAEALLQDEKESKELLSRMVVEEYARDSLENVLFALCRFAEMAGNYPDKVTIVGFEFKRQRFLEQHLPALRFPADRINYVGIDPPFDPTGAADRIAGELANSKGPFEQDPYGCRDPLRQKKLDRNPFRRR